MEQVCVKKPIYTSDGPIPSYTNTQTLPAQPENQEAIVENCELLHWMYGHHIRFYRPNTMVVMATTEYTSAKRIVFFKHLAIELEFADGRTTLNSMIQQCSRSMSLSEDEECRRQAPLTYDLFRQTLILPPGKPMKVQCEGPRPSKSKSYSLPLLMLVISSKDQIQHLYRFKTNFTGHILDLIYLIASFI